MWGASAQSDVPRIGKQDNSRKKGPSVQKSNERPERPTTLQQEKKRDWAPQKTRNMSGKKAVENLIRLMEVTKTKMAKPENLKKKSGEK